MLRVHMLSPVSFADVVNRTSTVVHEDDDEEEDLTRRASANEGWKSCDNSRNLWLDTLDDDCLSSDEDQNDSSNYSERNVRLKKDRFSSSSCTLHFFSSSLSLLKSIRRDLPSMKWSKKMLQIFLYFMHKKDTYLVFSFCLWMPWSM